jgi:4-hydroxybenzoate polyprenyltransferase
MFKLLALLQLTRVALAFTAIADAWAILLLQPPGAASLTIAWPIILKMLLMAVVSFGLYGFGMALNDLLDVRRDRIFAPRRPIPSGRIKPTSALVVALTLLMFAFLAAAFLTLVTVWTKPSPLRVRDIVPYSFFFALATAALIVFYDATAKYLGGLGLVTLGLIRGLHCLIGNPKTPLLFLSMILMTHVILVSTISYHLENKRPRLNKGDILTVVLGVLIGNGLMLWYTVTRHNWTAQSPLRNALIMLIGPAIAGAVYWLWAASLITAPLSPRQKGERLMLLGLFWLFMYDASMLLGNGQWLAGVAITLLLLCAVLSFFGIRWFSRRALGPRMEYRAERDARNVKT